LSIEEVNSIVRRFKFENYDIASREATHWLGNTLKEVGQIYREPILRRGENSSLMSYGSMYFFQYNPLTTESKLPFYDQFPLIVVLKWHKGSVLGINLHYLRHYNRTIFLNYLLTYTNIDEWYNHPADPNKVFLKTSYEKIKQSSPLMNKFLRASIKKYNFNRILGGAVYIKPIDWKIVPFLPLDRFVGKTREEVFKWAAKQ
jgi:hypothetical protein